MRFLWFMVLSVVAIFVKENFGVPAIRPLSQRGIIFPVDNWDNCYLDDASTRPGFCKKLEDCPDILKKWDLDNIYPKTCYFIKKQQYVCCPSPPTPDVSISVDNVFNTDPSISTEKLDNSLYNIFSTEEGIYMVGEAGQEVSTRPSNIFWDKVGNKTSSAATPSGNQLDVTTTRPTKPSNIFLDKATATFVENSSTSQAGSPKPPFDSSTTDQPVITRRSEAECNIQNPQMPDPIDVRGQFPQRNEFPFMAVLGWSSEIDNKVWYPCGGILISSRFVLTSAHCADIGGLGPSFVHLGDKNLTDSKEGVHKIKRFIVHPGYNETAICNDVALVELEQEVNSPMACLWTQRDLPLAKFMALGYGRIASLSTSFSQLVKAFLKPIDNAECQEIYKFDDKLRHIQIADSNLCAGDGETLQHFCRSDTGGPLIVELQQVVYVVGITSFGLGCADLPPSIFTRVSSFIDWIEAIVWPEIDVRVGN